MDSSPSELYSCCATVFALMAILNIAYPFKGMSLPYVNKNDKQAQSFAKNIVL